MAFAACLLPVCLGFLVPLLYLAHQSFKRGLFANFDMALWRDAFNSIAFASLATLTALLLGFATILAWRWRPTTLRFVAMNIAQLGYTLPGLVLALGLLAPVLAIDNALNALAASLGLSLPGLIMVGSGAAVVIAYVIRFLAVPTGFIKAGFERIPHDYDDSARAVGAGQTTTMRLIHLPLLRPAMLGAVIVVFVDCLKELPATLLLRPLNVETLATSIYQYASRGSFEEGALAALLDRRRQHRPGGVADAVFGHTERAGVDDVGGAYAVGWAEERQRRAHPLSSIALRNGGHAALCPPYGTGPYYVRLTA